MIQKQDNIVIESNSTIEESAFKLSQKNLRAIFKILRNSLYSNKELAVVREYSVNADEAMFAAGKANQPIRITLPTEDNPNFIVRDFGQGLTKDEMFNVFCEYGNSTKNQSNDFSGMFGIGSKSGFCYQDSFTVVSYQGGTKKIYSCYIDSTEIGKISLMDEQPTDEEDGLEIIVSVLNKDYNKFYSESVKFFHFWDTKPIFVGREAFFQEETELLKGDDWYIPRKDNAYTNQAVVIMGKIAYPFNQYNLDWEGRDSNLNVLVNAGVRIYVNIGDIDISASRESVEYNATTQNTIFSKLENVRNSLTAEVLKKTEAANTMYEAKLLYNDIFDLTSSLYPLRGMFTDALVFKGKKIGSNYFESRLINMGATNYIYEKSHSDRHPKPAVNTSGSRISVDKNVPIIIHDVMDKSVIQRIAPLIDFQENILKKTFAKVQLIKVANQEEWDKWCAEVSFDAPVYKLSAFPKIKLKVIYPNHYSSSRNSSGTSVARSGKVFELSWMRSEDVDKNSWQDVTGELEEDACFIEIDRYQPTDFHNFKNFGSFLGKIIEAKIDAPIIYGVKSSYVAEFTNDNPDIKPIKSYLAEEIKEIVSSKWYLDTADDYRIYEKMSNAFSMGNLINIYSLVKDLDNSQELGSFVEGYQSLGESGFSSFFAVNSLAVKCGVSIPASTVPFDDSIGKKLTQKYQKYITLMNKVPSYYIEEVKPIMKELLRREALELQNLTTFANSCVKRDS